MQNGTVRERISFDNTPKVAKNDSRWCDSDSNTEKVSFRNIMCAHQARSEINEKSGEIPELVPL